MSGNRREIFKPSSDPLSASWEKRKDLNEIRAQTQREAKEAADIAIKHGWNRNNIKVQSQ